VIDAKKLISNIDRAELIGIIFNYSKLSLL
jgi:hypothetical protein